MGKSSKDKRDAYYRLAKEQGWRARSAFKLLQLDEHFNLFEDVTRVVDLCAAPGSWSQVLSRVLVKGERIGRGGWEDRRYREMLRVRGQSSGNEVNRDRDSLAAPTARPRKDVRIVALDLQPMAPLEGITCLKADITHPSTIPLLLKALDPDSDVRERSDAAANADTTSTTHKVDLILSDGAPDVTGLHDLDIYLQSQLLFAALSLAVRVLKPGGKFVAKIFRGGDVDLLTGQMRVFFKDVTVAKPRSSRGSSLEAFVVCTGFALPKGWNEAEMLGVGTPIKSEGRERTKPSRRTREDGVVELELGSESESDEEQGSRWIAPFLACGDLSAFDADASHTLPEGYVSLEPVQPPTAPPYKRALEERRKMGGAYGKTKLGSGV
ncbi:tRNA (uridine-2'-O-)-methyltransferase trm7 [Oleoguttula sp. CCFEE 5521]